MYCGKEFIMMLKKEIKISFIKDCSLKDAVPCRCALNEGISLPFRAEVALFSEKPFSKKELDSCLGIKTELTLMQYNTEGLQNRGRKFQGIITAYRSVGLVSELGSTASGKDCYCCEITIEPEMTLMGIKRRTRSFDSGSTPADIISGIFEEYHLKCRFDNELFDNLPTEGQIAQQSNETDLNFINRICFNYGFNYFNELITPENAAEGDDPEFSESCTVFSRGWKVSNATQIIGNTLTGQQEITCTVGEMTAKSFGSGKVSLNRLISSGYMGSGSIGGITGLGSEAADSQVIMNGFETRRGEGSAANDAVSAFAAESSQALTRLSSGHALISAGDFAIAPGLTLKSGDDSYLAVRVSFSFNTSFPQGFKAAPKYPAEEQELRLLAVAVPLPEENTEDTLGPLCCFGRIPENPSSDTAFPFIGIPRPGRGTGMSGIRQEIASLTAAAAQNSGESDTLIYRATVCNASGKYGTGTGLEPGMIIPASDDDTAFPAMFYAIIDGASAAVKVNYVSIAGGSAPLGNFPKVAQRILILMTGGSYYLLGYLPDRNPLPTFHREMRNDLMHSSFLTSGIATGKSGNTDRQVTNTDRDINNQYLSFVKFSSSALLIEFLIMQDRLQSYLKCMNLRFNTLKLAEIYDSKKTDIKTNLKAVRDARDALETAISNNSGISTAKGNLSTAYTNLSALAGIIVTAIKEVTQVSDKIEQMKKADSNLTDDTALATILGLSGGALFLDGALREYAGSIECAASQDITLNATDNISLNAGKSVTITADNSITLQVGNSSISINGNTIAAAVAYFKYKISPWDAKITLSPTGGVNISGFQVNGKALMSSSISDSFGGSLGTKGGLTTVSGPTVKASNMSAPSIIKTLAGLTTRTLNAVADIPCQAVDNDKAKLADSIINDIMGYGNSIAGIVADSIVAVQAFTKASNGRTQGTKDVVNLAASVIAIAMDVADVLENLIANTIIKNSDKNYEFVKRTKDNNYISGHDIYLMTTSSIRTAALITKASMLMVSNLNFSKTSSMELNAKGASLTGMDVTLVTTTHKVMVDPLAGNDMNLIVDDNVLIDPLNQDISIADLTSAVAKVTAEQSKNAATNVAERATELASSTNIDEKDPTGDKNGKVTKEDFSSHKGETTGMKNEQAVGKDSVNAQQGDLGGSKTNANGANIETKATNVDTKAVSTGAGALDTDTKAMKLNS